MKWCLSHRADPRALPLADRHYNRQKIGTPQFVPPGSCMVLLTEKADALWVTSYPKSEYVHHAWAGAWVCSCFRNENQYNRKNKTGHLSSRLILEAIACTRWFYGDPPPLGIITFVNASKVRSTEPGRCYLEAGFRCVGKTKANELLAFQMLPESMPVAQAPNGAQLSLFAEYTS